MEEPTPTAVAAVPPAPAIDGPSTIDAAARLEGEAPNRKSSSSGSNDKGLIAASEGQGQDAEAAAVTVPATAPAPAPVAKGTSMDGWTDKLLTD